MKIEADDKDLRLGETLDITIEIVDPITQQSLTEPISETLSVTCTNSSGTLLPISVTQANQPNVYHLSADTGQGTGWTAGVVSLVVWLTATDGKKQAAQTILIDVGA